jgi:DNA-binding SARP family transcriptional activator
MTLLVRSGRRNRALAQYRRYVRELDESLGLSPSRAVKTAIRSILAGDFRLPGQDT